MINNSALVLSYSLLITLVSFSYQLRLFERNISDNFSNYTTAMWFYMITMFTIGYGDVYPKSHMGRFIGIIICGWGVFYVSLFVIALNNMLEFNPPELKAYNLLQRLSLKEKLRTTAAGALASTYKLKFVRKQPNLNRKLEILHLRKYRMHMQEFNKISKQIRNVSDPDADMEAIKNSVD
jgi:hypothetical protein